MGVGRSYDFGFKWMIFEKTRPLANSAIRPTYFTPHHQTLQHEAQDLVTQ